MSWKDLLVEKEEATVVAAWLGGRGLHVGMRMWAIEGRLPAEHGWYRWKNLGQRATFIDPADLAFEPPLPAFPAKITKDGALDSTYAPLTGYLIGDHLVADGDYTQLELARSWCPFCRGFLQGGAPFKDRACGTCHGPTLSIEKVHLIEAGLPRFARLSAIRTWTNGPLVYMHQLFDLGPEDAVKRAYEDQLPALTDIKGVTPALHAAYRIEVWQREEAERRRQEALRRQRELEAQVAAEAQRAALVQKRQELAQKLGDAAGRREMAKHDFTEAARAALTMGGAQYLDHRKGARKHEMVVTFRYERQRFECTCHAETLQIIDAGICLDDHRGTKGDTWFTLESLPSVIKEALARGKLVVFRHVD